MKVTLSAVGNPDFGEPRDIGIRTRVVEVASLADASKACLDFIAANNLGGGNWSGGLVSEGGKEIARVSYNGRVWSDEVEVLP